MSSGIAQALSPLKVIVSCGSGGVGKTTLSAALAMALVTQSDRRVLVLTVDPARRLATALGMKKLGGDPVRVSPTRLRSAGIEVRGELFAAMLDTKSAWDQMVDRYAPSRDAAKAIKANRFYQSISDAFVGSREYMAMEALYNLHAEGEYDCIVIDTPPSRNALDFLDAPARVSDFVGARMLSWLGGGSRFGFRALNVAATPFVHFVGRLIGADVLKELAEFVTLIRGLYEGVNQRGKEVQRLLRSPVVGFVVVTTLESAAFAEAQYFTTKLRDFSMPLRGIVVNRVLPDYLRDVSAATAARTLAEDDRLPQWLSKELATEISASLLQAIGEEFLVYHRLAVQEARHLSQIGRMGKVPVVEIPLQDQGVSDLAGLGGIARLL